MPKLPQTTLNLLLGVLVVNVIGLWTVYLLSKKTLTTPAAPAQTKTQPAQIDSNNLTTPQAGQELVAQDKDQLAALKAQLDEVSQSIATLAAKPNQATTPIQSTTSTINTTNNPQEHVIYLGQGSTTKRDWTPLESTKVTLNSHNYSQLEGVVFQASLQIINGQAQARLVNNSTGAIITTTEVSHNNSTATWKKSASFQLHTGTQEYVVELRSTSGEKAELNGARLIITTH